MEECSVGERVSLCMCRHQGALVEFSSPLRIELGSAGLEVLLFPPSPSISQTLNLRSFKVSIFFVLTNTSYAHDKISLLATDVVWWQSGLPRQGPEFNLQNHKIK